MKQSSIVKLADGQPFCSNTVHQHIFDNGFVLLGEPMNFVDSVSWSLLVPCGPALESAPFQGLSNLLCEMTQRGAGSRNSQEFLHALETLGCDAVEAVGRLHTGFGGSTLADNLMPALDLLADQVLRPLLPATELESVKLVFQQEIASLDDDPARKLTRELSRQFWPDPWGRSAMPTWETLERITFQDIQDHYHRFYQPQGSILSIAGHFDWDGVRKQVEKQFGKSRGDGNWEPQPFPNIKESEAGQHRVHLPCESAQTHIGVAFPCAEIRSPEYLLAWSAVEVLSGGMSSRLYDEMREKRGLCYAVDASYSSLRDRAGIFCYCCTAAERAQESLDVLLSELNRLRNGISEGELRRLKIRAKSVLVMQQESTEARSSAMARDWFHLGRVRSLPEILSAIEHLTQNDINSYFAKNPPTSFHIVTLGAKELIMPAAFSAICSARR